MSQLTLQSQRSAPGKILVVDGKNFISLGQVGWPVGDGKFCVVDMVMEAKDLNGVAELRDVKAVVRVASATPAEAPAKVPAKPNRQVRRRVAKTKRKH